MPQSVTAVAAGLALVGVLVNFSIHKIEEGKLLIGRNRWSFLELLRYFNAYFLFMLLIYNSSFFG